MVPLRTDIYVPVMMAIAISVATTARSHGYDVLLLTGEEGPAAVRRGTGSGAPGHRQRAGRRHDPAS